MCILMQEMLRTSRTSIITRCPYCSAVPLKFESLFGADLKEDSALHQYFRSSAVSEGRRAVGSLLQELACVYAG